MSANDFDGSRMSLVEQPAAQDSDQHSNLINSLTKELENGNGCHIKEVLRGMPFEESLKTMKEIEVENKRDRGEDSSLPAVHFLSYGDGFRANAELYSPAGPHWWNGNSTLIKDTLAIDNSQDANLGDRSFVCTDISKPNRADDK